LAIATLTSRNQVNVLNKIVRGGLYTNITSGGVTEAAIDQGGVLGYSVPAGKKAKFKGTIVVTSAGSQNRIFIATVDNVAGRIVPVGSVNCAFAAHKIQTTFLFDGVLENSSMDFTVAGDIGSGGGAASIMVEIEELPA